MCRYAYHAYKPHYACFACRKAFKRKLLFDLEGKMQECNQPAKCPECGELMANMGKDFEAPKKTELKKWEHIKTLYKVGITFHSCGCSGPGYVPNTTERLVAYFEELKQQYLEQLSFWRNRVEPTNKKEIDRDNNKNWEYISKVPYESKADKKTISNEEAKAYWLGRINEIDQKLNNLSA